MLLMTLCSLCKFKLAPMGAFHYPRCIFNLIQNTCSDFSEGFPPALRSFLAAFWKHWQQPTSRGLILTWGARLQLSTTRKPQRKSGGGAEKLTLGGSQGGLNHTPSLWKRTGKNSLKLDNLSCTSGKKISHRHPAKTRVKAIYQQ